MAAHPPGARQATRGGPGSGMTRGSVRSAAPASAAHAWRVAALTASVKYTRSAGAEQLENRPGYRGVQVRGQQAVPYLAYLGQVERGRRLVVRVVARRAPVALVR